MKFTSLLALTAATALLMAPTPVAAQLNAFKQETGLISVSSDGNGNNAPSGGLLQVSKPAGATVRVAYLAAAGNFDRTIGNGEISLSGVPLNWDATALNGFPGDESFFNNVLADVTAIVKPIVDGAPAGLIDIPVTEVATGTIDGTVLTVIFDDPNVMKDSTIILLFGGQATNGDTFFINLAEPLKLTDPTSVATMGLGISFSHQGTTGTNMISEIDVNGQRLTSSAGGEDDGEENNGALLTAGGIGDTVDNPPPFAGSSGMFTDDELYSLLPFVNTGDMQITVATINPTNDDNIFFGYFVTSVPAAIGESILLAPVTASKLVGDSHTVTATVKDDNNNPVVGRTVNFHVLSGPNTGDSGSDVTDVDGKATFTYLGDGGVGTDTIVADELDSNNQLKLSNEAKATWQETIVLIDNGCAGTHGTPVLTLTGSLLPASAVQADVTNGLPNAPGVILLGIEGASLVRKGCSLLFVPSVQQNFTTNGVGAYSALTHWPAGVPSAQTLYLQAYVLDGGAPTGFATSNTLQVTTP